MENQQTGKPRPVTVALYLLWASLAITLAKFGVSISGLAPGANIKQAVIIMAATLAIYGFLIVMIAPGRNWARIVLLVLFLLGLVPSLPSMQASFNHSLLIGVVSIADLALQAGALFLLFTSPGKDWFRKQAAG